MTETQTTPTVPATGAQGGFIANLLRERTGYSDGFRDRVQVGINSGAMTKAEASRVIEWMLKLPKRAAKVAAPAPVSSGVPGEDGTPPLANAKPDTDVPAGHYAAEVLGSSESLSFFRVDRPTTGKWAGFTFVKHVVGGHPDYPVKGAAKFAVLRAIEDAGVVASAVRYATEFRRCVHCNTQLTDELSRRLCVGPHCRVKYAAEPLVALMAAAEL